MEIACFILCHPVFVSAAVDPALRQRAESDSSKIK